MGGLLGLSGVVERRWLLGVRDAALMAGSCPESRRLRRRAAPVRPLGRALLHSVCGPVGLGGV